MSEGNTDRPIAVLNVNDSEVARYTTTRMLRRAGFTVSEAGTGGEALVAVAQSPPDVVLLDVKLPDLSGFEVCARIKADPVTAGVAVLMTSAAFVRAGDRVQGLEGGADGYMVQPAEAIELVATVRALARARRVENERNELLARERRARAEAEAATERFRRLYAFTAGLARVVTASDVAEATVEHAVRELGASAGALLRLESATQTLKLIHAVGYPADALALWQDLPVDREIAAAEAVRTGRAIYLESRAEWEARYPAQVMLSDASGLARGSRAALPLTVKGQAVGALVLSFAEYRTVAADDRDYVLAVAAQGAQALERARLYEAERHARDLAEQASRAKDEFLATVSHELRTPLNAILGWARMLNSGQLPEASRARALETIDRNARAQAQLIDDILDVSRIISGKLRVELRPVDLASVVSAACDAVRPAADARGVRMDIALDPDLGFVAGDPDRLQQVAWNLLSNAVKFTPRDGVVSVRLQRVEGHVSLEITDSGQGIASEFLPYVFERFRQADSSSSRTHGGLGLGLAIVRHLVELHGGTVRATSDGTGHGASFIVSLPEQTAALADPARYSDPPPTDERHSFTGLPSLAGLRVLVVDDEPDARDLMDTVLHQFGAQVTTAASAREALESIERNRPDVLVSDIAMPGEDGYVLIRAVRAREHDGRGPLPAAALTAYARADDARRALSAGFDRHVAKPVHPSTLVTLVAELGAQARSPVSSVEETVFPMPVRSTR